MGNRLTIDVPLNRVEGDLEVRVEVENGVVVDAWCSGTMYRGFENILAGRGASDGLLITPRICGICSTSHLTAAALALDMAANIQPPQDAVRIRNLTHAVERLQSDMRHTFLMYTADFVNPNYKDNPLYDEACLRYRPFQGRTVIDVINVTKKLLEIIAIFGGQWPHSSYMVPGGIASIPSSSDILQAKLLLKQYRNWYESKILGCGLERWTAVKSKSDIDAWLEENDAHRNSELGFFIQYAESINLDKIGGGHNNFIGYNGFQIPPNGDGNYLIPEGFSVGADVSPFNQERIGEHVAYSWFKDYSGGKHPFNGETRPYATGQEGKKYSWAKAPRYEDMPAETGPLAEMVNSGNPLFTDLIQHGKANAFVRQLARVVRQAWLIPVMEGWLDDITDDNLFYKAPSKLYEGEGYGLTQAARGALGHWIKISGGKIEHYQIITPTAWNASPRDQSGVRGPMEEALVGTPVKDADNPVELGHVVRSFDACLVCTVHTVSKNRISPPHIMRTGL